MILYINALLKRYCKVACRYARDVTYRFCGGATIEEALFRPPARALFFSRLIARVQDKKHGRATIALLGLTAPLLLSLACSLSSWMLGAGQVTQARGTPPAVTRERHLAAR